MKKHIFFLFTLCAMLFAACGDDDNDKYIVPEMTPNKNTLSFEAKGGSQEILIKNAEDVKVTTINDKDAVSSKDTNVEKVKDPRNCTEAGWFTVKVVQVDGKYRKLVFTASSNPAETQRTKYVHVSCGGNLYGVSFLVSQSGNK